MNASAYTGSDANWLRLQAYLEEQDEDVTEAPATISYSIVQPPESLDGGDALAGQTFFNESCVVCHGINAAGTVRGPALAGTELSLSALASKIRLSGSRTSDVYDDLTGGRMPFWSAERLSDNELLNLIAYLETSEAEDPDEAATATDISVANAQSNCGSTSGRIGQSLTLSTLAHRVTGTVTIVDDCTLKFTNFSFDGGGIDVRIYSGINGDFDAGQAISKDIFGLSFDAQEVSLKLPASLSVDDFNSVSVWCVDVGVSFGDGTFQ